MTMQALVRAGRRLVVQPACTRLVRIPQRLDKLFVGCQVVSVPSVFISQCVHITGKYIVLRKGC